jgi:hypothetical protein
MAARERWLRGVGVQLDLRGAFFRGGSLGVTALKRPDAEPELEPEKEEVRAPNITVTDYCTTRPVTEGRTLISTPASHYHLLTPR